MIIVIQIISFTHIEKNYNYIFAFTQSDTSMICNIHNLNLQNILLA